MELCWRVFPLLLSALLVFSLLPEASSSQWPVPYRRHKERPQASAYCKALYPFCPTGYKDGHFPDMDKDDTIEVFVLKAPVWEFKFGDLLGHFHIIHDAIGFRSKKTGLNYTTEWYELFQLFNCTFPHIVENRTDPLWCNQGAACLYPGITDKHWSENGTLLKVGEMTGEQFNKLADYVHWDNHTGIYYETWRVRNSTGPENVQVWFNSYDCAGYIVRLFQQMAKIGTKFTEKGSNYTYMTLITNTPQYLGNDSTIFGPNGNKTLAAEIMEFYTNFQAHQPILHFVESLLNIYDYIVVKKMFYLYYNSEYWLLPMKDPYVRLTYEYVPFAASDLP